MCMKYITSCTRPPVWQDLWVNRSFKCGLISLLPPVHSKIGTERHRMPSHRPAISPYRAFNSSQQLGLYLCTKSCKRDCLAYPNSYRSYLVYSRLAWHTACPTVGQSNHSKTTCSILISLPSKIKIYDSTHALTVMKVPFALLWHAPIIFVLQIIVTHAAPSQLHPTMQSTPK